VRAEGKNCWSGGDNLLKWLTLVILTLCLAIGGAGGLIYLSRWPEAPALAGGIEIYGNIQRLKIFILSFGLWAPVISAFLMVVLGGPGTLIGPCLGAGVIIVMRQIVSSFTQRWAMVLGVIYIVSVMCIPGGLMGMMSRLLTRLEARNLGGAVQPSSKGAEDTR